MPNFPAYDGGDEEDEGDEDEFRGLDVGTLRISGVEAGMAREPADPLTESGADLDPRKYLTASDIPASHDGALARARHGADSDPSVGVYVCEQGFLRTVGDDYLLQRDGDWTLYVPDEWQLVDYGGDA
jgi:hypothetical protein